MNALQTLRNALVAVVKDGDTHTSKNLGQLAIAAGIDVPLKSNGVPKGSKKDLIASLAKEVAAIETASGKETIAEVIVLPLPPTAAPGVAAVATIPPPPGAVAGAVTVRGSTMRGQSGAMIRGAGGAINPLAGLAHTPGGTAHVQPGQVDSISARVTVGGPNNPLVGSVPVVQGGAPAIPPPTGGGIVVPPPAQPSAAGTAAPTLAPAPVVSPFAPTAAQQAIAFAQAATRNMAAATAVAEGKAPGVFVALSELGKHLAAGLSDLEQTLTPSASPPAPPGDPAPPGSE